MAASLRLALGMAIEAHELYALTNCYADVRELASLELALGCCETTHAVPASYHLRTVLLLVVGAAIAYGVTVWLATPREAKPLVVGTAIAGGETVWQASHEEARPGVRRR